MPVDSACVQGEATRGCAGVNRLTGKIVHHAIYAYREIPYFACRSRIGCTYRLSRRRRGDRVWGGDRHLPTPQCADARL